MQAIKVVIPVTYIKELADTVKIESTRLKNLYDSSEQGPVELWLQEHQPRYDQLDSLYDCGSPNCPKVGFKSKEDKDFHYLLWGITQRKGF